MISKSILTALEYVRDECRSHTDFCKGCVFFVGESTQKHCFFTSSCFDGAIPDQWDIDELKEILGKENENG